MEKLTVQTQEFLAYDPWGNPRILSRSGTFVTPVEEKNAASPSSAVQTVAQPQAAGRVGNSRLFGGFEQYRQRLLPKSA